MVQYLSRLMFEARRKLPLVMALFMVTFLCAAPCFGQSILVNTANGASATAVLIARAAAVVLIIVFAIIMGVSASSGHAGTALMGFAGLVVCVVLMILAPQAVTMITNWANSGAA